MSVVKEDSTITRTTCPGCKTRLAKKRLSRLARASEYQYIYCTFCSSTFVRMSASDGWVEGKNVLTIPPWKDAVWATHEVDTVIGQIKAWVMNA